MLVNLKVKDTESQTTFDEADEQSFRDSCGHIKVVPYQKC